MLSTWELTNATARLVLPPGGLIVLALVGLALVRLHARAGVGLSVFALVALYVLAAPVGSRSLLQTLEDPYSDPVKDRKAAAIVVLGGGSYSDAPEYGGDTVSKDTLERLRYAALLHRRTGKPVMVSGGNPAGHRSSEGEQMRVALRELGVTTAWVEAKSRNTMESARIAQQMFRQSGIDTVYIVTHAWHIPRAKMAFEHAGLRVVPAPTGFSTAGPLNLLDFVPSPSGLRDSFAFFHEIAGIAWYRLKFARER